MCSSYSNTSSSIISSLFFLLFFVVFFMSLSQKLKLVEIDVTSVFQRDQDFCVLNVNDDVSHQISWHVLKRTVSCTNDKLFAMWRCRFYGKGNNRSECGRIGYSDFLFVDFCMRLDCYRFQNWVIFYWCC